MAEVYVARADGIGGFSKSVALKVMLPHLAADEEAAAMFLREARIASQLEHPNVVHVFDVGSQDGLQYLCMEYLRGVTLRQALRAAGRGVGLPTRIAAAAVVELAEALEYAHELRDDKGRWFRLVHRDVSPSNVILTVDGAVKLLDFGIAHARTASALTQTGMVKGKSGYMSPEQARGEPLDRRSDVFSLGVVLYESMVGVRPFVADDPFGVAQRTVRGVFVKPREIRPEIGARVEAVICRALRVDPEQRFQTARSLGEALRSALADDVGVATRGELERLVGSIYAGDPDSSLTQPGKTRVLLPGRRVVAVGASLGLGVAAVTAALWMFGDRSERVTPKIESIPTTATATRPAASDVEPAEPAPNPQPDPPPARAEPPTPAATAAIVSEDAPTPPPEVKRTKKKRRPPKKDRSRRATPDSGKAPAEVLVFEDRK